MIARVWHGWTRPEDAKPYARYVAETGIRAYRATPGNRGAWLIHRADVERALDERRGRGFLGRSRSGHDHSVVTRAQQRPSVRASTS